jgi:hypothetical protein
MTPVPPRFQIKTSDAVLNKAKSIAYERGLTLTDFVLQLLAKEDDGLKKLIEKDIAGRKRPGSPAKS